MNKLQSLNNGIYCLDAEYIKNEIAAVYFIVEGDSVAIVETATSRSVPIIMQALADLDLSAEQVKFIIPTHIHLDHAGGCGALLNHCPNATILIHPRGLRHMIDPSKLVAGAQAVYGEEKFHALYGEIEPIDSNRIIAQEDNTSVFLNNRELLFIHTEGHAKHHFCIVDKNSEGIFTGDTFGLSYPAINALSTHETPCVIIPTTTPIHFDPAALRESLKRFLTFHPKHMYLTHFGDVTDVAFAEQQLQNWVDQYENIALQAIKEPNYSEETIYQQLLDLTQHELATHHGLSAQQVTDYLTYDLKLNAQGIYHYCQSL